MLGDALNTRFILVSLFSALCIGVGMLLWQEYQDRRHSVLAKYLLVTLDVTFVFILVLIVRYTMDRGVYETTSDIPAFLVLFVINAISGLRFDFRLSAYSALVSVLALAGLTIYDIHTHTMSHPYLVVTSLFKGVMLLGVAFISGYIGTSAKKLVMHDYKEQREKRYVKDLFELNEQRATEGKQPFRHRIGIHTGEVLAGNTGSDDQPSYALIGDTVNVAARLQELNKEYGTEIIFSAATRERMQRSIPLRTLKTATLKGISRPIETFTLDDSAPWQNDDGR